ncbi:hypothetical protein COCON_G00173300 [Conger conger]|uniref:Uncharacterized protein n=1 Tax=Conger conger TaxID=82655 RepID=A0A9Q1D4A0_CONCO|nr:hypothetical protein COCON_G00173300 [Conger conger]
MKRRSSGSAETAFGEPVSISRSHWTSVRLPLSGPVSISPSLDQCPSPPLWTSVHLPLSGPVSVSPSLDQCPCLPLSGLRGKELVEFFYNTIAECSNYEETDFIISYCFAMKLNELQSVNVGLFVLQSGRSVSRSYHLLSDPGKLRNAPFPAAADDRAVLPGEADACAVLPGEAALT